MNGFMLVYLCKGFAIVVESRAFRSFAARIWIGWSWDWDCFSPQNIRVASRILLLLATNCLTASVRYRDTDHKNFEEPSRVGVWGVLPLSSLLRVVVLSVMKFSRGSLAELGDRLGFIEAKPGHEANTIPLFRLGWFLFFLSPQSSIPLGGIKTPYTSGIHARENSS